MIDSSVFPISEDFSVQRGLFLSHIDRFAVDERPSSGASIIDAQYLLNRVARQQALKSQMDESLYKTCAAAIAHAWGVGLEPDLQITIEKGDEDGVGPYVTFWRTLD